MMATTERNLKKKRTVQTPSRKLNLNKNSKEITKITWHGPHVDDKSNTTEKYVPSAESEYVAEQI